MNTQQAALQRLESWWHTLPFATEEDEALYTKVKALIEDFWYT